MLVHEIERKIAIAILCIPRIVIFGVIALASIKLGLLTSIAVVAFLIATFLELKVAWATGRDATFEELIPTLLIMVVVIWGYSMLSQVKDRQKKSLETLELRQKMNPTPKPQSKSTPNS
jgi:uncharacterized membrane protein YGL010W